MTLTGSAGALRGWSCRTTADRAGTVIYLHGVADNRGSARGAIDHFGRQGFDVLAFDSRAHGSSDGEMCTYGYWEARDLGAIVDLADDGPVVLLGTSLGAAVALQYAPDDSRVRAVIAAETFSDLRTVATERAPWFFTAGVIDRAFVLAEARAQFQVAAVSPAAAAARIRVPVLLIHGADDVETPPAHSQRVFAALAGPKRLLLVHGAGHNQSLGGEAWAAIDGWLDQALTAPGTPEQ